MSVQSLNLLFAVLTLAGLGMAVCAGSIAHLGLRPAASPSKLARSIARFALPVALIAAAGATAGSLYYSEVAGYRPCLLCWVQRGFMYPSAIVLAAAVLFRRPRLGWLALVLAGLGLPVAVYHRVEQQVPDALGGSCGLDNPCSARWVDTFGFITIPTMAAMVFVIVAIFVTVALRNPRSGAIS